MAEPWPRAIVIAEVGCASLSRARTRHIATRCRTTTHPPTHRRGPHIPQHNTTDAHNTRPSTRAAACSVPCPLRPAQPPVSRLRAAAKFVRANTQTSIPKSKLSANLGQCAHAAIPTHTWRCGSLPVCYPPPAPTVLAGHLPADCSDLHPWRLPASGNPWVPTLPWWRRTLVPRARRSRASVVQRYAAGFTAWLWSPAPHGLLRWP